MGYVYIFVSPSGKAYVGKTTQEPVNKRFRQHEYNAYHPKRKHKSKFYAAIRKYGFENFTTDVLSTADDHDKLSELEELWIAILDTQTYGYNLTSGGEGCIPSPEALRHMSESQKGHIPWNKGLKGIQKQSEEQKQDCRERMTGQKNPFYGRKHTEENKRLLAEIHRQLPKKTRCIHGHEFAIHGKVLPSGRRICKICTYTRNNAWSKLHPRTRKR